MTKPRFTIFVFLRALPAWLALPREQRRALAEANVAAALKGSGVALRHFDAEAFTAICSDISLFEADDLIAFYAVMERLRDSVLFTKPYFELVQIIPAIEDGFQHYEQTAL
jgi:Darcynin, domain of unknown function